MKGTDSATALHIASAHGSMECGGPAPEASPRCRTGAVAEACGEPVEPDGDAALARAGRKKRCGARKLASHRTPHKEVGAPRLCNVGVDGGGIEKFDSYTIKQQIFPELE